MSVSNLVSPKTFARLTGQSISTVRRRLEKGQLPAVQSGGRNTLWRIDFAAYQAGFQIQPTTPALEFPASAAREPSAAAQHTPSAIPNSLPNRAKRPRWANRFPQS